MTTSEMLIRAKADLDEVYNVAYEKGKAEGESDPELVKKSELFSQQTGVRFGGNTEIEHIEVDCSHLTDLQNAFQYCSNLKTIKLTNTGNVTKWAYAFTQANYATSIESIEELDFSSNTTAIANTMLNGCTYLTTLKIVPQTIKVNFAIATLQNLDDESIQSVIDGLADLTGQTSQTLSVHGVIFNRMTDEQKTAISSKNWTLSAVA